ncbi:MAG: hypothetical protein M9916_08170 [Crocinitomicaceae bacterium]|nr:hypothetical protein [Crocinitomicaceae bacterium]
MNLYKLVIICLLVVSCKKDKHNDGVNTPVDYFKNGLLVVNEGLFQQNNSSLSWIDFSTGLINNEVFEQKTDRQLGDTGNDIGRYGNKIYVVVTTSSTLEILDAKNGNSLKQINMVDGGTPKQPRFVAFTNGKAFISCFDGYVDVLDTTSLTITQRIKVGANPNEIHVANNKIYTVNSGGLSYPNVDSTISVIDPISLVETQKIVVGKNPYRITSDNAGNLYIVVQTGLNTVATQLVKVKPTLEIDTVFNWPVNLMTKVGSNIMIYTLTESNQAAIQLFNPTTKSIVNSNFIDASLFTTFYGAQYDAHRNQIYCFDAMSYVNSGYVRVFTSNGVPVKNYQIRLNPSKTLIYE